MHNFCTKIKFIQVTNNKNYPKEIINIQQKMNQFRVTSGQKEMLSAAEDYADTVNFFKKRKNKLLFLGSTTYKENFASPCTTFSGIYIY